MAVHRLPEDPPKKMGMVASRQTFSYDEAGSKCEEVSYNEDGTLGSKAIFTRDYDEHGNWTKELVSTVSSWDADFGAVHARAFDPPNDHLLHIGDCGLISLSGIQSPSAHSLRVR